MDGLPRFPALEYSFSEGARNTDSERPPPALFPLPLCAATEDYSRHRRHHCNDEMGGSKMEGGVWRTDCPGALLCCEREDLASECWIAVPAQLEPTSTSLVHLGLLIHAVLWGYVFTKDQGDTEVNRTARPKIDRTLVVPVRLGRWRGR